MLTEASERKTAPATIAVPMPSTFALSQDRAHLLIAVAILVGATLRVLMARGDLWLDEVWSLSLVQGLSSPGEVVYGLPHDNNHVLNSLWMVLLGPTRPSWAYRVPAVLLGTLSVGLAAHIFWRHSRASAVAAALLSATALPMVVYGSEARGYAGLIATTLFAIGSFERLMERSERDGTRTRALRWQLGLAIGIGTFSHLTMVATLAVLGLVAFMRFARRQPMTSAVNATVDVFAPSFVCLVPAFLALLVAVLRCDGFVFGGKVPASGATFVQGYGDQLRYMLGLSAALPAGAVLASAGLLVVACIGLRFVSALRCAELFAGAIVCPALMMLLRCPNLAMPRYYLVAGLVVMLAMAEMIGRLWNRGTIPARALSLVLLALCLFGHATANWAALRDARGRYGDALAAIADSQGIVRFGTHNRFRVEEVAIAAAGRRALTARFVPDDAFCSDAPGWFVDVPDGAPPPEIWAGTAECRRRFILEATVPTNLLSGMRWSLYRRVD